MYRLYVWGSIVVGVTSEQECLDFAWSKETTTVAFCFFPGNNSCVWSSKVNVKECYADGTGNENWYMRSDGLYLGNETNCLNDQDSSSLVNNYATC